MRTVPRAPGGLIFHVVFPLIDKIDCWPENFSVMIGKKLNAGQRRALALLAGAGPGGCAEATMTAHGCPIEVLGALVRGRLADAALDAPAGRATIEATRIMITDSGRIALMM